MPTIIKILLYFWCMNTYKIYALVHPVTLNVFYVGNTGQSTSVRLSEHISRAKKGYQENQQKDEIIKSIIALGERPTLWVLEELKCDKNTAIDREGFWIDKLKLSHGLTNISPSGHRSHRKGITLSQDVKTKIFNGCVLRKPVQQINKKTGEVVAEFIGVREAWRQTKIDHRSIAQVAGGSKIRKSAGGYLWRYTDG